MNLLLEPIAKYAKHLSLFGETVKLPERLLKVWAKVVMGIFDLPAKVPVLNMKQFNREYGCSVCLHPGRRLHNNARVYLPNAEEHLERTHEAIVTAASVPINYMHCVLEGVTQRLTSAWVDSKNHSAAFYIGLHIAKLDNSLLCQHPPLEFSRPPRSIKHHFIY